MLEAYSVAVKLRLVNEVSGGLAAMSRHFAKAGMDAKALQKEIDSIKFSAKAAFGMMAVGAAGIAMFKVPLEEAKKFQVEVGKFGALGFGEKINSEAVKFASGMQTIGTSARDNMAIVGDAMAVFKDLHEAKMVSPLMAKMKFANEVLFGKGGVDDKKLMDMMKVAEFRRGTTSPEEFARQVNFAQQAIAGSRNRVDPSAMLLAMKTGGLALSQRSNAAFYLGAEPLIQEFGGSRYGTGAMSLYQNLVQSRGSITAQQELYRLGLLNPSMVEFNMLGRLKKARPGAFYGSKILEQEGELALLEKVLLPAFAKKGIVGEEAILREIGMIAGNRTGTSLLSRIYQQMDKLKMQTAANYNAENLDQATKRASGTLQGKEVDLEAKWHTLMKDLGITVLPLAIKGVEGLTWLLKGVSSFAERFPTLTAGMMGALGAVSIALLGGGAALGLNAAFRGLALVLPDLTAGMGPQAGILSVLTGGKGLIAALTGPIGLVAAVGISAAAIYAISHKLSDNQFPTSEQQADIAKKNHLGAPHSVFGGDKFNATPFRTAAASFVVHNTVDERGITTKIIRSMGNAASQPQTGYSGIDSAILFPSPANAF